MPHHKCLVSSPVEERVKEKQNIVLKVLNLIDLTTKKPEKNRGVCSLWKSALAVVPTVLNH